MCYPRNLCHDHEINFVFYFIMFFCASEIYEKHIIQLNYLRGQLGIVAFSTRLLLNRGSRSKHHFFLKIKKNIFTYIKYYVNLTNFNSVKIIFKHEMNESTEFAAI